jgi:hypothetical protein
MMYVHPKASKMAKDFVQFVLSGRCDAICRSAGYVPGLRAMKVDISAAFEGLYGAEVRRVKATPQPEDDIALAGQILQAARTAR